RLIDDKLREVVAGVSNQSAILDDRLKEVVEGLRNQSTVFNDKLREVAEGVRNQSSILNEKLTLVAERQAAQLAAQRAEGELIKEWLRIAMTSRDPAAAQSMALLQEAKRRLPLLYAERTYNTSHPDYDAALVRNHPGHIFNAEVPCGNPAFAEI